MKNTNTQSGTGELDWAVEQYALLLRLARKKAHSLEDAEDIVQNTILEVAKYPSKRSDVRPNAAVYMALKRQYLLYYHGSSTNTSDDPYKRGGGARATLDSVTEESTRKSAVVGYSCSNGFGTVDPSDVLEASQSRNAAIAYYKREIAKLNPRHQQILLGRFVDGRSVISLAEEVGITYGAARNVIYNFGKRTGGAMK